jgi:hypothetical protein
MSHSILPTTDQINQTQQVTTMFAASISTLRDVKEHTPTIFSTNQENPFKAP